MCQRKKDCLGLVGGKKYQDGRPGRRKRADRASCTGVASIQACSHPSSSKLRMHMKRLGDGRLPAIHHAQFTPAVGRQGPWPASDPTWREVRCYAAGDGRCLTTRHWAAAVSGDLCACGCEAAVLVYARATRQESRTLAMARCGTAAAISRPRRALDDVDAR